MRKTKDITSRTITRTKKEGVKKKAEFRPETALFVNEEIDIKSVLKNMLLNGTNPNITMSHINRLVKLKNVDGTKLFNQDDFSSNVEAINSLLISKNIDEDIDILENISKRKNIGKSPWELTNIAENQAVYENNINLEFEKVRGIATTRVCPNCKTNMMNVNSRGTGDEVDIVTYTCVQCGNTVA